MILRQVFRYRIYPTKHQQAELAKQFGHARFAYNWALAERKMHYQEHGTTLGYYEQKRRLTQLKRTPEHVWLQEADSQVLQAKVEDLNRAYRNYFEKRAGKPRFKSKHHQQSIRYPQRFKFEGKRTYLPKVGWVKTVFHRAMVGQPKNLTVTKTKCGEYYVSVQCEMETVLPEPNGLPGIGVDLGLRHFATLSDGTKVDHPQYLRKSERKLKRLQRNLSRKHKGSKNRDKARLRVARQHAHVARQRKDFLDKLSHRLVHQHGLVALEDLSVNGMVRNHHLSKSISDSGWGMFRSMCEYKAPWYGSEVAVIDRFEPSSKRCHHCGCLHDDLTLADRFWACNSCGVAHDRDVNAAINILSLATVGATER